MWRLTVNIEDYVNVSAQDSTKQLERPLRAYQSDL